MRCGEGHTVMARQKELDTSSYRLSQPKVRLTTRNTSISSLEENRLENKKNKWSFWSFGLRRIDESNADVEWSRSAAFMQISKRLFF